MMANGDQAAQLISMETCKNDTYAEDQGREGSIVRRRRSCGGRNNPNRMKRWRKLWQHLYFDFR